MNKKTRKLGISVKLLVPSIAVIIIVCVLISTMITSKSKEGIVKVGGQVAQSVATAATGRINVNQIDSLLMSGEKASNIDQITETMNTILDSYDAINMYIIGYDKDADSLYYALATGKDSNYSFGEKYNHDSKYLSAVINEHTAIADEYMSEKSGVNVITAYAPILKSEETLAILACDYDASDIQKVLSGNSMLAIIISIVCAIAGSVLIVIIVSAVVRNLNKVNDKVYELASNEGDLTQSIDVNSGDETELIATNFNILLEYIRTIMLAINDNADSLKSSSGEIVNNLGDARENVNDISNTMENMSEAMRNTTDSIGEVALQLQDMNEQIESIRKQAVSGSESTGEINKNAEAIRNRAIEAKQDAKLKADAMADTMHERIEKSKEVEQINTLTQQILTITNQTRLLSLNASIEAARAGELGKGFSVVAEEIGKLANESGEAAGKIQEVSRSVIGAVTELAAEAENMIKFLDEVTMAGYDELEQTGISYSKDANELSVLMENFAKVSERLQQYSDSIHRTVDTVNATAEETAMEIANVSDMTSNMADKISSIEADAQNSESIAVELNMEVNKFRLN